MDQSAFEDKLRHATNEAVYMASQLVADELPDSLRYLIIPAVVNKPLASLGDLEVFPEDTLPIGQLHLPAVDIASAVAFLWRRGKIPHWVNVGVARADSAYTYISLTCAAKFSEWKEFLDSGGHWEFHVLSPVLPSDWAQELNARWREEPKPTMADLEAPFTPGVVLSSLIARRGKFFLEDRKFDGERAWHRQRTEWKAKPG